MNLRTAVFILIVSPAALAGDPEAGKSLYYETEFSRMQNGVMRDDLTCAECHSAADFTEPKREAKNYKRVHYWVNSCNHFFSAGWFPEEVDDVAAYLNQEYYRFPQE